MLVQLHCTRSRINVTGCSASSASLGSRPASSALATWAPHACADIRAEPSEVVGRNSVHGYGRMAAFRPCFAHLGELAGFAQLPQFRHRCCPALRPPRCGSQCAPALDWCAGTSCLIYRDELCAARDSMRSRLGSAAQAWCLLRRCRRRRTIVVPAAAFAAALGAAATAAAGLAHIQADRQMPLAPRQGPTVLGHRTNPLNEPAARRRDTWTCTSICSFDEQPRSSASCSACSRTDGVTDGQRGAAARTPPPVAILVDLLRILAVDYS